MWTEARHLLAMAGDEIVTVMCFIGLLMFAIVLLLRGGTAADRLTAIAILVIAALWLALVTSGLLRGDLARWSPLAVFLLALGIEVRPRSHS